MSNLPLRLRLNQFNLNLEMIETSLQKVAIEENIEQFLLVLLVALSVAILPQIISWFRRIPYTLLLVIVGSGKL